ncbi:MAG: response regulator transcription factor [Flavobacteriia bacterium]|nr:response regulator transcription factor [Flavobacteriia bacterium]
MSSAKILLVDDEPILLKAVEFKLQKEGLEVITATSGEEAIEKLQGTQSYDLIISDVMMPGLSGIELLKIVKEKDESMKVLLLTGLKTEDTVVDAFDLGADDFMTKPFNPKELVLRVKKLLKS